MDILRMALEQDKKDARMEREHAMLKEIVNILCRDALRAAQLMPLCTGRGDFLKAVKDAQTKVDAMGPK